MFIYTSYEEAKKTAPYCIALGSFDGVHKGHIKLIEATNSKAKELKCKSMIYTFLDHPKKVLSPGSSLEMITGEKIRRRVFEEHGLDCLYLEEFSNIRNINYESFIKSILLEKLNMRCVVAGYNFRFGQNKEGDTIALRMLGEKLGFEVFIVEPVLIKGEAVSSSFIRGLLKEGKMKEAELYLGRYFSINGVVIHGKKNGDKIGVKTANVEIKEDILLPKKGVYHTYTVVNNKKYKSITNIGHNPTFKGKELSLETHIIGYSDYIYGKEIEVIFLEWHRDEKLFNTIKELKEQINNDINSRLATNI